MPDEEDINYDNYVPTVGPVSQPAQRGGGPSPLQQMFTMRGLQMLPPPGAFEGALSQRRAAYDAMISRAQDRLRGADKTAMLFALAGGLLSPTKTNSVAESFGQGAQAAAPYALQVGRENDQREDQLERALLGRGNLDYEDVMARYNLGSTLAGAGARGSGGITINTGETRNPGADRYSSAAGERAEGYENTVMDRAEAARGTLGNIQTLEALLAKLQEGGLETGALTDWVRRIGSSLRSAGIDVNTYIGEGGIGNLEAARAISGKMVMDALGGSLGPGVSNQDREFLAALQPSITNTPEGNKILIEIMKRAAQRNIDAARAFQRFKREMANRGELPLNGRQFMEDWANRRGTIMDQSMREFLGGGTPRPGQGGVGTPSPGATRGTLPNHARVMDEGTGQVRSYMFGGRGWPPTTATEGENSLPGVPPGSVYQPNRTGPNRNVPVYKGPDGKYYQPNG